MKKTSVFLALILILSLLPLQGTVFAIDSFDDAKKVEKMTDAKSLLSALDIDFRNEAELSDEVSRRDFLNVLMQLLKFDIFSDIPSHGFEDIDDKEVNLKLSLAVSSGIVSKAKNFYPDRSVSYEEAFKMTVVALGYAHEAQLYGGYLAAAHKINLTANMSFSSDAPLTYGNMFLLLSNFLNTDIRKQITYGDENKYAIIKGNTPLTEYFDVIKITGIIDADENTSLYDPVFKTARGYISINGQPYLYNGSYTIGTCVSAYIKTNESVESILCMQLKNSSVIKISSSDMPYLKNDTLYYSSDSKIRFSDHIAVFYNGKAYISYNDNDFAIKSGNLLLIDNNSDNTVDAIHINENTTAYISEVNLKDKVIFLENGTDIIDLFNSDVCCKIFVDGEVAELQDIPANSIVSCYTSKDGTPMEISVSTKAVTGNVTEISTSEKAIYIDGVKYIYNPYFENNYISSANPGVTTTFLLDIDGYLSVISLTTSSMQYGYLIGLSTPKKISDTYKAKIFTQSGNVKIYSFAEKVTVDSLNPKRPLAVVNLPCFYENGVMKEQLIRYTLNKDDKLSIIDTEYQNSDHAAGSASLGFYEKGSDAYDSLKRYGFSGYNTSATLAYKTSGVMVPYFRLNAYTPIFIINTDTTLEDIDRFSISTRNIFVKDQRYASNNMLPYDVTEDGLAEILVYYDPAGVGGAALNEDSAYGVVSSFTKAIIPSTGEIGYKITLYNGNVFEDCYIKNLSDIESLYTGSDKEDGKYPLSPGDYIRYILDSRKIVKGITKDFDASSQLVINYAKTGDNSSLRYDFGKVYAKASPSYLTISSTNGTEDISNGSAVLKCINVSNIGILYDSKTDIVSPASYGDIVTYITSPDLSSTVLIKNRYALGYLFVIYK